MNVLGILVGFDHGEVVKTMRITTWGNVIQTALDSGAVFDECDIYALGPCDPSDIAAQAHNTHLTYPAGHLEHHPVVARCHNVPEPYNGPDLHNGNGTHHPKTQEAREEMQSAQS